MKHMPIWAVAIYDETTDFEPSHRGVIKAPNYGAASEIASSAMGDAKRIDLTHSIVRDESQFKDGYTELPTA
jgi:hypothetical protein